MRSPFSILPTTLTLTIPMTQIVSVFVAKEGYQNTNDMSLHIKLFGHGNHAGIIISVMFCLLLFTLFVLLKLNAKPSKNYNLPCKCSCACTRAFRPRKLSFFAWRKT